MNARYTRVLAAFALFLVIAAIVAAGLAQTAIAQTGTEIDLQLTSTVSAGSVVVGEQITVTLTVVNLDPRHSVGELYVWIYNLSDGGLKILWSDICVLPKGNSILWKCDIQATLPAGDSLSVQYVVKAKFPGMFKLYQFVAYKPDFDPNFDSNNALDVDVEVLESQ